MKVNIDELVKRPQSRHCKECSDVAISTVQPIMNCEIASLRSQRSFLILFTNASNL